MALYQVSNTSESSSHPCIEHVWTKQVHEDSSIPALFLAWAPTNWFPRTTANGFAVTFSDSRTAIFGTEDNLTNKENITEWASFPAKQMIEVWFVALATYPDPMGTDTGKSSEQITAAIPFIFTGNDFGSLHTRRLERHSDEADRDEPNSELLAPVLLDHDDRPSHHTAGVTAILPLPIPLIDDAPVLLTGSYDEGLRVYHATRRGEVLAKQGLGGGVWRLQLLNATQCLDDTPQEGARRFLVMASCMHVGTRVVLVTWQRRDDESDWVIEVLAEFGEHESMNYASDVWKGLSQGSTELLCISSSFYDRRVCVWTIDV